MRILLAHKYFDITGGAEVFFRETGRVLEKQGHAVAYFSTKTSGKSKSPFSNYFVESPAYNDKSIIKRVMSIKEILYSNNAKNRILRLINDFSPDLIHVFAIHVHLSPSILVAAYEKGIPVVMSCNDYKHICPNYKLYHHGKICMDCKGGKYYMAIKNRCCKNSLGYSAVSALEAYLHKYMNIYKKYVHTYLFASNFMALCTEEFWGHNKFVWKELRNPYESRKYDIDEISDNYALYFGRLIDEKGVDTLIRAASLVPDVKVRIVGDGPETNLLKSLANKLKTYNIEFIGPRWGSEMDELISRAKFVVMPSIWHENFPYVAIQSFAMGKAVVGSNRGGIPELVEHNKRGLIYDAQDVVGLSKVMKKMWDNPELAKEMGRAAKEYVNEEFNDEIFYEKLIGIYKGVLNEVSIARR